MELWNETVYTRCDAETFLIDMKVTCEYMGLLSDNKKNKYGCKIILAMPLILLETSVMKIFLWFINFWQGILPHNYQTLRNF